MITRKMETKTAIIASLIVVLVLETLLCISLLAGYKNLINENNQLKQPKPTQSPIAKEIYVEIQLITDRLRGGFDLGSHYLHEAGTYLVDLRIETYQNSLLVENFTIFDDFVWGTNHTFYTESKYDVGSTLTLSLVGYDANFTNQWGVFQYGCKGWEDVTIKVGSEIAIFPYVGNR